MKSFMEEYGKSIVVAIVIVALIGVACVFRDNGTKSIKSMWKNFKSYMQPQCECLCFTANTAGSTVAMYVYGTPTLGQNFEYSTDGENWTEFTPGSTKITLANVGDKVYFRGNNPSGVNENPSVYYRYFMTGSIAASGNIMSLIDNGTCNTIIIPNEYCFYNMFWGCSSLTTAPKLPATTLTNSCYYGMFKSCTSLTTAPALPASTLVSCCYQQMFSECSALYVSDTAGSEYGKSWIIPNNYYQSSMFKGCAGTRSSNNIPGGSEQLLTYYTQNTPV